MRLVNMITGEDLIVEDRLNIAPTEDAPVLLKTRAGDWTVRDMRWWLVPFWASEPSNKYSMFNAKSETLASSRAFKEPFARRRCVVLGSGYYEWHSENGVRMPNYIVPADAPGFAFAGLWDRWHGDDQVIESCTIVTTAAPAGMDEIHTRMPVHLTNDQVERWINLTTDPDEIQRMLVPELKIPLAITPVSTYVNSSLNKDERCLEAIGETKVIH